jgi:hypothetical protein
MHKVGKVFIGEGGDDDQLRVRHVGHQKRRTTVLFWIAFFSALQGTN